MSRYSDHTPSSHIQAYPPYPPPSHAAPTWYGPPPTVPASLTVDAQALDVSQTPTPPRNVGRDYMRSLGTSMQGLSLGAGGDRDRNDADSCRYGEWDSHSGYAAGQQYPATYALVHHTPPRPVSTYQPVSIEKPLPRLPPPPPLPARPHSDPPPSHIPLQRQAHSTPPSSTLQPQPASTPPVSGSRPKTFKPSPYLHLPSTPPRPASESALPTLSHPSRSPQTPQWPLHNTITCAAPNRTPAPRVEPIVIDLTLSPSTPDSSPVSSHITPRSPARVRRRAASDQPPRRARPALVDSSSNGNASSSPHASSSKQDAARSQDRTKSGTGTGTPRRKGSPAHVGASPARDAGAGAGARGDAVQCAGYTRTGERCKRVVRAAAPYAAYASDGVAGEDGTRSGHEPDGEVGRYCKDHAGMICQVEGFYSRDRPGLWVSFEDWIPPELGQQTQTLLRTTMESRLTAKESPGFIYVYELRELQTPTTSFFKVGRTDNVPRRLGEWTNQCQSRTPTLRDIFPLSPSRQSLLASPSSGLNRAPTLTLSLLPGAMSSGTIHSVAGSGAHPTPASDGGSASTHANPGAKRWERLVHLELAELAARERAAEWEGVRAKCADCGRGHREVFALPRSARGGCGGGGEDGYAVLVEVVCRWERFVRMICA